MNAEKYLPWVAGIAVVGVGVYLYRTQTPTQGTQVLAPPDNSQAVQAAAQQNQNILQAGVQGFGSLVSLVSDKYAQEAALVKARIDQQSAITLAQIDAVNQNNAIKGQVKIQTHHDTWSTIGTAITALAIFCYKRTANQANEYPTYTHGNPSSWETRRYEDNFAFGG